MQKLKKTVVMGREYFSTNDGYYTGKIEIYYDYSNKIKVLGNFERGLKSGEWKYFFEDGSLEKLETYAYGELNGLFSTFYESNGNPKEVCEMKYDKINGHWMYYYETGNLKYENDYKMGKQNGIWKEYYETGSLKAECPTNMGTLYGNYLEYNEQGQLIYKCFMRDGVKNGDEIYYTKEGREIYRTQYVSGKQVKSDVGE